MWSFWLRLWHSCLVWAVLILEVHSIAIDNGISNGPEIECDAQALILTANTRNPFSGRIYVKGESSNSDCIVNYTEKAASNIEISVPLTACNVRRLRIPGGAFEYTTTIVVSFHHIFETKVDRAYRVHCVFSQLNNTFTAPSIEVSMIPTTETLTQTAGTVTCQYEVRRGSLDGPPLRYAIIGEPVFHVWKCESPGMRILVRDCYVDDGGGNKVPTIDSRGCAIDRYVIQTPTYIGPDYTMVYTEAHVFKYADRPTVLFQCQIQMCDATDTTCQEISPPTCNGLPAPTSGAALPNITGPQGSYLGNQTVRPVQGAADVGHAFNLTTRSAAPQTTATPQNFTPPLSVIGSGVFVPANFTAPPSPFGNVSLPGLPPIFVNGTNLTAHSQLPEFGNISATTPHINATSASIITATPHRFDNATGSNVTLPFPTPGPMILTGGNHTSANETALEAPSNATRRFDYRIRRTAHDRPNQMDGYVWDVISNEFTVMDLEQELKHNDHPEAQKYVDDGSEMKEKDFDYLAKYSSPDDQKSASHCVAGYEIALAISVVVTLIITSTAAVAVYWNVKHMRKQIPFHP